MALRKLSVGCRPGGVLSNGLERAAGAGTGASPMKATTAPALKPALPAVTVRPAENGDGPAIGALVVGVGFAVATLDRR